MQPSRWLAALVAAGLILFVAACARPEPMGEGIWRAYPQRPAR